jgi:O-antigen ligase
VYADMLLLMLPVLLAGCFVPGGRVWKSALIGALLIGSAGLALTLSRGAWISTAVAGMVLIVIAMHQRLLTRRQLGHLAAGLALAALIVVPPIAKRTYERITASNESNLTVRFEVNWIAVSMIKAHPLTGIGLSNFIPVMSHYDPTNVMRRFPATVHNLYLLEGAEAGVPGALLVMALFGVVLAMAWRRLPMMRRDRGAAWVAAAIVAGTTGFLVSQLADFSHRLEPLRSVIWMNLGLLFALQRPALWSEE